MDHLDIFDEMLCTDEEFITNIDNSHKKLLNDYKESINNYNYYRNTLNPMYIGNIKNIHDEFFLFEDTSDSTEAKSSEQQGLENIANKAQATVVNTGGGIIKFITWITERIHQFISWIFKCSIGLLNLTSAQVARWTGRITLNLDISDLTLYNSKILPSMEEFYNQAKICLDINVYRIKNSTTFDQNKFRKYTDNLRPIFNKFYNLKINGATIDFREGADKFFYLFPYIRYPKKKNGSNTSNENDRFNYGTNETVEFERDDNGIDFKYQLPKSITEEEKKNIVKLANDFIAKTDHTHHSLENHCSYMELLQFTLTKVRSHLTKIFDGADGLKMRLNNMKSDSDFRAWLDSSGSRPILEELEHMILDAMSKLTGFLSVEMKDAQTIVSTMRTILQEENKAIADKDRERRENNEKTDINNANDANALV